jgi:ketosteroid isomerase-like protein
MDALIDRQVEAFLANDPAGAVSVYTDDVVHRMVGPTTVGGVGLREADLPLIAMGRSAPGRKPYHCSNEEVPEVLRNGDYYAEDFYTCYFTDSVATESLVPAHSYYGDDFAVIEFEWTGPIPGHFQVVPKGHGQRVTVPWLMVYEFRDGLISRHDMWVDCVGILGQLMQEEPIELPLNTWACNEHVVEGRSTNGAEIDAIVDQQLAAFAAGDADGVAATCTEDIEFEVVGFHRVGFLRGNSAVRLFHACLLSEITTTSNERVRTYYGDDFAVVEHDWSGTVPGHFLAISDGEGLPVNAPWIRVLEFRDGKISRERIFMNEIQVVFQLSYQLHADQLQPAFVTQQVSDWANRQQIGTRVAQLSAERAAWSLRGAAAVTA